MEIIDVEESINTLEQDSPEDSIIEEPPAITIAEKESLKKEKRNHFYDMAKRAAIVFCIAVVALMTGFKLNEDFFDANSRISLLMERLKEEQQKLSYPKLNVRADFIDEPSSRLAIRLNAPISTQNISVREEFTRNKVVITLSGASADISDGVDIVSDSAIMDAVGVYRQDTDVVVEVYCKDTYSWTLENKSNELSLTFGDIKNAYGSIAVVYMPFEDKNRLVLSEWQQSLSRFAADNNLKLFLSYNMQEDYTAEDIVDFANRMDADMLLGVSVSADDGIAGESARIVCNSKYFIPNFGSTQLAITAAETILKETRIDVAGFRECGDSDVIVKAATVPAAFIEISQPAEDMVNVEASYKLNENIIEALKDTFAASLEYIGGQKP